MASTVGTVTTNVATGYAQTRYSFHANGRFWVLYSDGTNMGCRTSLDGAAWSAFAAIRACSDGHWFSTWFDGTYVHYASTDDLQFGTEVLYRRGTPNSDGTITWSADEQTALPNGQYNYIYPFVSVDTNGYPLIAYFRYKKFSDADCVTKSSTNDGTWATASGFPYVLTTLALAAETNSVIPLTNGKMYVVYPRDYQLLRGRLWNGSSWGDEETISTSAIRYCNFYSVVAEGDDVHIVFNKDVSWNLIYIKRTYGTGWGSEVVVQSTTAEAIYPLLSINTANNDLYCFWPNSPTANHLYYKKCVSGTWDSSPTDWIDESTDGLTGGHGRATSYYKDYGSNVGLLYMTKAASPYNVRFAFLELEAPPSYYHGLKVQGEAAELALCDVGSNPLRFRKSGTTYGIEVVATDDPNASRVRIKTPAGIKAIRRYT